MADEGEMTFWEHLDVLRGVLFKIAAVIIILGIAAFCVMPWLFDHVVTAPCRPDFPFYRLLDFITDASFFGLDTATPFDINLVAIELTSQFYIHLSASCWTAFVVGFPIILYLLWSFVSPGLYEREKRGFRRSFIFGNVMFFIGVAVGYFVVFPLALRFLATYSLSDRITPMISLDSYMDNFFILILLMGVVFELPLLAWILGKAGLLTRSFFSRYRRHAIVVLLATAGFITPTGDPFTLFAVFIPIYALWEFSGRLVPKSDIT
ncbi:MAG: twin-arginine translocase subunit TatC [Muribaculaceae bacterium]